MSGTSTADAAGEDGHSMGRAERGRVAAMAFLDAVARLRFEEWGPIIARWRAVAVSDSWFAAEAASAGEIRGDLLHVMQDEIVARIYALFKQAPWFTASAPGARIGALEPAGQYVATVAAIALLVGESLAEEELATLYAPFEQAIPRAPS
jgi:hypothetical protein